ncbi:MAG: bifunctional nuclease family protein [Phycisphaeraceae bacterium]|nr:bifunctional nuclease family protein [Phycisphaeraceae bacterium]MCW5767728.1 bifunctional nuclease family protein [Phycisphaeraceae bacterium]
MAVRMELSRVLIRELNDYQLIELREIDPDAIERDELDIAESDPHSADPEEGGLRSFPIVIGLPEAQAIERRLKNIPIKRPQTHDLLAGVIAALGGTLQSITICDLSEGTFFATLDVETSQGELLHIDARPSDAIALGIANDVPIYVEEHVLEAASKPEES